MIFRSGKYKGKSLEYVRQVAPWYIRWVGENRPEMLVEQRRVVNTDKKSYDFDEDDDVKKPSPFKPNLNFDSEPPEVFNRDDNIVSKSFWD
jgi:hypothetical protein